MTWKLPEYFYDNFDEIGLDYFKTILDQSEKILSDKIQTGEAIRKRAFTIIGVTASVLTLSLGFFVTNRGGFFEIAALFEAIFCLVAMLILIWPMLSYVNYPLGSSPKELLREEWLENFSDEAAVMKNLLLNLILTNEVRITYNERLNSLRAKFVDVALLVLGFSPVLSFAVAAIAD